jgi:hypothetical protein
VTHIRNSLGVIGSETGRRKRRRKAVLSRDLPQREHVGRRGDGRIPRSGSERG